MMSKQLIIIIVSLFMVQFGVYYWSYDVQLESQVAVNNLKSSFQKEFANPTKVTTLDLSGRNLTKIPNDFSVFSNVKYIDLSNNQLTEIPDWLLGMKLSELNLSHNQLTQIPNFKNASILELNLSYNQIRFPSAAESSTKIDMPKGLEILNLSNNNIQYLPSTLDLSEQPLKEINVSNNPIDAVQTFVFKRSLEKVVAVNSKNFLNLLMNDRKTNYYKENAPGAYGMSWPYSYFDNFTIKHLELDRFDKIDGEYYDVGKNKEIDYSEMNGEDISVSYPMYDTDFSSFKKLEVLKLKNITKTKTIIANYYITTLELKSQKLDLSLNIETKGLRKFIVNENTLKGIICGEFTAPILKTLIIERENNEDITLWISKFKLLYPNVDIKIINS